jgi:hypothetical protein
MLMCKVALLNDFYLLKMKGFIKFPFIIGPNMDIMTNRWVGGGEQQTRCFKTLNNKEKQDV